MNERASPAEEARSSPGEPRADIVLATLNARYSHASFGLRCLRANLGPLRERSVLVEGTLSTRPLDFVALLLAHRPRVIGLGVYLWNATLLDEVVRLLKRLAPDVIVVLGGPEVSHEVEAQPTCALADHVVRGEGEVAFRALCEAVLTPSPLQQRPAHVLDGGTPELDTLRLPYDEYTDEDLAQRTVYVEASRGCPFRCAFCLSALDKRVRPFALAPFLQALDQLWQRGLRRFKFVDRTFNLAIDDAVAILRFFQERRPEELFLHFEMIPDRLPDALVEELAKYPPGAVQLEVGLQTFDDDVAATISRRTNFALAEANIRALRERTGVHVHADLIAGLPDETWSTFAAGFDRLVDAGPQEIQLGILKRLRGAPLTTIPEADDLVFTETPPYEVLKTSTLSFDQLMELRRMARTWDAVVNQGRLPRTSAALVATWRDRGSVFDGLHRLSRRVHAAVGDLVGVSLEAWAQHAHGQLVADGVSLEEATRVVEADWTASGRRRAPTFLSPEGPSSAPLPQAPKGPPKRQARHLDGGAAGPVAGASALRHTPPMQRRTHEKMDPTLCGKPIRLAEGEAEVELTCLPSMAADARGLVHGGFTFGLADHAAMLAVNEPTVVLGGAETRFLAPTQVGDVVKAHAKIVERKGKKVTVDATCAVDEREVFSGRFVCFVPEKHVLDG